MLSLPSLVSYILALDQEAGHCQSTSCLKGIIPASLLHQTPAVIGIELSHCTCRLHRGVSQILLKQHSILINDECHYARVAVLCRISDERESARHFPRNNVVLRAAPCLVALPGEHVEEVAVKRHVRVRLYRIPFGSCERGQGAQGALWLTFL